MAHRFTVSERGHRKLIHNGFMYMRHSTSSTSGNITWRCDQSDIKCTGKATTTSEDVLLCTSEHNHQPDWGRCGATEAVAQMTATASTSRACTSAIVQGAIARVSSKVNVKLSKTSS